jgi:hypothetical protein
MKGGELEARYSWVGLAGLALSALCLGIGLVLYLIQHQAPLAGVLLHAGLLILMATPALRVVITTADRLRRRDMTFVMVTVTVLLELVLAGWLATRRL